MLNFYRIVAVMVQIMGYFGGRLGVISLFLGGAWFSNWYGQIFAVYAAHENCKRYEQARYGMGVCSECHMSFVCFKGTDVLTLAQYSA